MDNHPTNTNRRHFLKGAAKLAAVPLVTGMVASQVFAQPVAQTRANGAGGASRTAASMNHWVAIATGAVCGNDLVAAKTFVPSLT